jgi:hypothetical protein
MLAQTRRTRKRLSRDVVPVGGRTRTVAADSPGPAQAAHRCGEPPAERRAHARPRRRSARVQNGVFSRPLSSGQPLRRRLGLHRASARCPEDVELTLAYTRKGPCRRGNRGSRRSERQSRPPIGTGRAPVRTGALWSRISRPRPKSTPTAAARWQKATREH